MFFLIEDVEKWLIFNSFPPQNSTYTDYFSVHLSSDLGTEKKITSVWWRGRRHRVGAEEEILYSWLVCAAFRICLSCPSWMSLWKTPVQSDLKSSTLVIDSINSALLQKAASVMQLPSFSAGFIQALIMLKQIPYVPTFQSHPVCLLSLHLIDG